MPTKLNSSPRFRSFPRGTKIASQRPASSQFCRCCKVTQAFSSVHPVPSRRTADTRRPRRLVVAPQALAAVPHRLHFRTAHEQLARAGTQQRHRSVLTPAAPNAPGGSLARRRHPPPNPTTQQGPRQLGRAARCPRFSLARRTPTSALWCGSWRATSTLACTCSSTRR